MTWTSYGNYDICIALVRKSPAPHELSVWLQISHILAPYFQRKPKAETKVELWTPNGKRVPLGATAWAEEEFHRWCTPDAGDDPQRIFGSLRVNYPKLATCVSRGRPPDAYFAMSRNGTLIRTWETSLLLAVDRNSGLPAADSSMSALVEGLEVVSLRKFEGPFAEPALRRGGGRGEGLSNSMLDWVSVPPADGPWKAR